MAGRKIGKELKTGRHADRKTGRIHGQEGRKGRKSDREGEQTSHSTSSERQADR